MSAKLRANLSPSAHLRWLTLTLGLTLALAVGLATDAARAGHHEKGESKEEPVPSAEEVAVAWGAELFAENCASCHGAAGKGDGAKGEKLEASPTDLTTIAVRNGGTVPVVRIREIVDGRQQVKAHGPREMPVWGEKFGRARKQGEGRERAARSRTRALVSYIETIQEGVGGN